jgi:hypothetical protein
MAGYSGTPLARKLGIAEGDAVASWRAPDGFAALVEPLPPGARWKRQLRPPLDVVVAFFERRGDVAPAWPRLTAAVAPAGMVWVAWPKRASGIVTDLTEQTFRDELLPSGWVDTKVCAIDDTWSGLRFVLRKELRGREPRPQGHSG